MHQWAVWVFKLNSLQDDKIMDFAKLKAFADDKLNVAKVMFSVNNRIENIVGKGENAGNQYFLLFPQCLRAFLSEG